MPSQLVPDASTRAEHSSSESVQGMVKLETLLENAVDRSFDLFELYLLRNTFHVDTDLIPYITLEDQVSVSFSLSHHITMG